MRISDWSSDVCSSDLRHVAPAIASFLEAHPDVDVSLDLSDRIADLANENIDCAIRVGELTDSRLVRVHLAENRRVVVASPAYLKRRGTPKHQIGRAHV